MSYLCHSNICRCDLKRQKVNSLPKFPTARILKMSYVCIGRLSTNHLMSGINIKTTHFKSKLDFELRS